MKGVVIVNKSSLWVDILAIVVLGLLCTGLGYRLAGIPDCPLESVQPSLPATAMEKWTSLALQQAKYGDFIVTNTGEVFLFGARSVVKDTFEDETIFYRTRYAMDGDYHHMPVRQMMKDAVAIIKQADKSYRTISQCFSTGKVVTTVGPEKWACGG